MQELRKSDIETRSRSRSRSPRKGARQRSRQRGGLKVSMAVNTDPVDDPVLLSSPAVDVSQPMSTLDSWRVFY